MEEDRSTETKSSSVEMSSVYKKGGPFYKLVKREYSPSMNILKTFDLENPQCSDMRKDTASSNWWSNSLDAFVLILGDVDGDLRECDFTTCQVAAVYEIFYSCFKFLMLLPALEKERFLEYFRETLVLYCVQDPPEALRIFNGIQAFKIAKSFHKLLEKNFELMKYVLVGEHTVEFDVVKDL